MHWRRVNFVLREGQNEGKKQIKSLKIITLYFISLTAALSLFFEILSFFFA